MEFGVLGLNHSTASVAQLEQVALSEARRIDFMLALIEKGIDEVVLLSTCGRTEVYFAVKKDQTKRAFTEVLDALKAVSHLQDLVNLTYQKQGTKAIEHLIQVAVGLDSIVLGEDQIIGQIKTAHQVAKDMGCTGRILNVIFRDAIAAAKRIKTALKISEIPLSLSYVGVKTMAEVMGSLVNRKLLVVGLGEMGQLAIVNALALGARVSVTNRSLDRLKAISDQYPQVTTMPYEMRYGALGEFDGLIAATAAPHMLFTRDHFEGIKHPMVALDLSLPKDIDDQVASLPHIQLINLDTLAATVDQNKRQRQMLVSQAHQMITGEGNKIAIWLAKAHIYPTIQGIDALVKESHDDALDFIDAKLNLDRHQRALVDRAIEAALKRLVRNPIKALQQIEDEGDRKMATYWLNHLFLGKEEALRIEEISPERWQDFETLFEKHGGVWGGCWCTFHLLAASDFNRMEKGNRKSYHQEMIRLGKTSGVLLYEAGVPVGWCQFGPATSFEQINRTKAYKALEAATIASGDQSLWPRPDWRITCLFVDKHYRKRGYREKLLQGALQVIKNKGGGVIEAFPLEIVGNTKPQYSGSVALYERQGFKVVGPVGKSKVLMRLEMGVDTKDDANYD